MSETFISDGKLEAKVVSTAQNDKGWYIRLLLHPSDTDEVTKLRVGAVLDIRWREVLNVEVEPIEIPSQRGTTLDQAFIEPVAKSGNRGDSRERPAQPKQRFEALPLVQQCAMRCEDPEFIRYLTKTYPHLMKGDGYSAAIFVRSYCGVASRSEIKPGTEAERKWFKLEDHYQNWATDQKYGQARR